MKMARQGSNLRPFSVATLWGLEPHTLHATALLCLILSGCATLDAKVAIPVSCVKDAPAKPQTAPEVEIAAMSDYAATLTIWTERLLLKAYAEKASATLEACK